MVTKIFHLAAASIWGMMALRLANEEILPFNYMSYAIELEVRRLQCSLNVASVEASRATQTQGTEKN